MMFKSFLWISITLSLLVNAVWATPISHPNFQSTRGDSELKATATATWMTFIDVYDAALYAQADTTSDQLLTTDLPFTLEIRYKLSVKKSQLIEAAEVALTRQHDEQQLQRSQADVAALHGFYRDVEEGDRFRIGIVPDKGLSLYFNDDLVYQNSDMNFAKYYVGLWLADNPLSDKVRTALLDW